MTTAWSERVTAGTIKPQARHINELRDAVDNARAADWGLGPWPWLETQPGTNDLPSPSLIKAQHYVELQAAVQDLWVRKGLGNLPNWTSSGTAQGPGGPSVGAAATRAYAADLADLRRWFSDYEAPPARVTRNISANFGSVLHTVNTRFGMNEKDRVRVFYQDWPQDPGRKATVIQNFEDLKTWVLRVPVNTETCGPNGNDLTNMDKIISAVLQVGAIPFVTCWGPLEFGVDNNTYANICAGVVSHYSQLYGSSISNWYWETINEPDASPYNWETPTFIDFYNLVSNRMRAATPHTLKIGGPSLMSHDRIATWFDAMNANDPNSLASFLSWHRYGIWGVPPPFPSDEDLFAAIPTWEDDVNTARAHSAGKPIVYGECNVNSYWQSTDPRIKNTFNVAWYSAVLMRVIHTAANNFVDMEMFWEGSGNEGPDAGGFGMWYSAQRSASPPPEDYAGGAFYGGYGEPSPVYWAKRLFAACCPYGATVHPSSGDVATDVLAVKSGAIAYVLVAHKAKEAATVNLALAGLTPSSVTLAVVDSKVAGSYTMHNDGKTWFSYPVGVTVSFPMTGYSLAVVRVT